MSFDHENVYSKIKNLRIKIKKIGDQDKNDKIKIKIWRSRSRSLIFKIYKIKIN